jgi:hypothetical protein
MRRRHFLHITLAGAAATAIPFAGCEALSGDRQKLSHPLFLTHFCDEAAILEIGRAYQAMDPVARDAKTLADALMKDVLGESNSSKDTGRIPTRKIDDRIRKDFSENLVVTPAGWVLSRTEARQCALFSLTA